MNEAKIFPHMVIGQESDHILKTLCTLSIIGLENLKLLQLNDMHTDVLEYRAEFSQ